VIAAVVIGVGVYVVLQPEKGTVEYHKKEYVKASEDGLFGTFLTRGEGPLQRWYSRREQESKELHLQALIDMGYLCQKVYVISNCAPIDVLPQLTRLMFDAFRMEDEAEYPVVRTFTTSNMTVVARPDELNKWDDVIRQVDVPLTK
jgi:hypothetical protein